jgi:hypothetical protein
MLHGESRFQQQQALLRIGQVEPASLVLVHDHFVVVLRFVPEQRQLKAVLAVQRAVTTAAIAADLRQYRHHIGVEAEGRGPVRPLHQRGGGRLQVTIARTDDGAAIRRGRDDPAGIDARYGRRFGDEAGLRSYIHLAAVGAVQDSNEFLA